MSGRLILQSLLTQFSHCQSAPGYCQAGLDSPCPTLRGNLDLISSHPDTTFLWNPGGIHGNSPAFQRRVGARKNTSPEGTAGFSLRRILELKVPFQPSLWDLCDSGFSPGVETPGYFHLSLRDIILQVHPCEPTWRPTGGIHFSRFVSGFPAYTQKMCVHPGSAL
jgi:hypothetical protein